MEGLAYHLPAIGTLLKRFLVNRIVGGSTAVWSAAASSRFGDIASSQFFGDSNGVDPATVEFVEGMTASAVAVELTEGLTVVVMVVTFTGFLATVNITRVKEGLDGLPARASAQCPA
ncbi:hypothetical protein PC128_g24780 [Phytophthora cactorum]|nr:hypothetical protein PC128_g24780 [Phytophthora cactorum]